MSEELQILKKHLGAFEGVGEFASKQLCSQISDANDFIGALQVLDMSLKRLTKCLQSSESVEQRGFEAKSIVQNALFAGESLFGTQFSTRIGSQEFRFEIQNPLSMLENAGFEGVLAYTEDKREEISALFDALDEAIEQDFIATTPVNSAFKDFKELFG